MYVRIWNFSELTIDDKLNENVRGECAISTPESKVKVLRIPTNEELVIARDTEKIVTEQLEAMKK